MIIKKFVSSPKLIIIGGPNGAGKTTFSENREDLGIEIDFLLPAARVVRALDQIIEWRGKPQQNAYIERYNRTVRYDWLGQYLFDNIEKVQEHATRWLWTYNNEQPNMALGGITSTLKLAKAA